MIYKNEKIIRLHLKQWIQYCNIAGGAGCGGGGGPRSHSLGDFFAVQKPFVCLKEAPKQTLCSLLSSDIIYIASNSMLKTSCTISGTSVADTRKW